MSKRLPVYLEAGDKRTFAGAVDWPGWSRSARTADEAIETLVAYGRRYRKAMGPAGSELELPADVDGVEVVDRLKGGGGTDFGVPSATPKVDGRPVKPADLTRLTKLLETSWHAAEKAAALAKGVELRKGPRGGGRDVPKILSHLLESDEAYMREFARLDLKATGSTQERWSAVRTALLDALAARVGGAPPPPMGRRTKPFWTPRYLIRRSAWHALDHAWEIEDRASTDPDDG